MKNKSIFGCVLKGDKKHLEKIKEHIVQEYAKLGTVKIVTSTFDNNEIHMLTPEQWKEYQKLKKYRKENLIGAGFP